jgi:hypothetical protein
VAGGSAKGGPKSPGCRRSQGRRGLGPEGQFLRQSVGEGQDEVPLLAGSETDAGAAHGLSAPDEALEAHEVVPQLHREPERPAVPVGELLRTQQILRQVHPPDICQPGGQGVLVEILPDPGDIDPGDFVQQVLSHGAFPEKPIDLRSISGKW